MLWSAQSVVQSGALWDRLPILRYVVVSTVSGAVGSTVGQIANTKVCCGQHSQWCSREHWDRLPILRYVVVSTVSGAVGSIVGQIVLDVHMGCTPFVKDC